MLSKKIIAFLSRNHVNSISKDLYDIYFLFKITDPNFDLLRDFEGINSFNQLYERLFNKIENNRDEINYNFYKLAFNLIDKKEIKDSEDLINKIKKIFY